MDNNQFEEILTHYTQIKNGHVNPRLEFYIKYIDKKRLPAERAKAIILGLSLLIPIVANLPGFDPYKGIIVAVMSLSIALLSGLNDLYQWEHLWRAYSQARIQIESLLGLWELNVAHARQLSDPNKLNDTLEQATETLLKSVDQIVSTEMGTFFTATQHTPETSRTSGTELNKSQ